VAEDTKSDLRTYGLKIKKAEAIDQFQKVISKHKGTEEAAAAAGAGDAAGDAADNV
jgi:hypothetical protein